MSSVVCPAAFSRSPALLFNCLLLYFGRRPNWNDGESNPNCRRVVFQMAGLLVGRRVWVRGAKMVKMAFQISMIETPREPGKPLFHTPSLGMLHKLWSAPKCRTTDFATSVVGAAS